MISFLSRHIGWGALFFLIISATGSQAKTRNAGFGPLEVRNHYPVTSPYLWMYPESTATLEAGSKLITYSVTGANTFINTQGRTKSITRTEFNRGIQASDFNSASGEVVPNLGLYIDVESYRQRFRFKYGLTGRTEFSLEVPFISMVGGVGDGTIESFHDLIGVSNSSNEGAYRAYSDKDQFGYYVARNGELLVADKTPVLGETFLGKRGDTTLGFKWNLLEGGRLMPAFTVKLNYKVGNGESTDGGQTTSGADDRGYMLTLSKGFDPWFVYFGQGVTMFGKSESWQSDSVFHRFLSLEYQMYSNQALVIQNVIQTSMFPAVGDPESTMEEERDNYNLQASTALLMVGYKLQVYNLLFETGVVQDYSNRGNETDFAIFFEAGLQW